MLPIQFAIELETAIISQLDKVTVTEEVVTIISLIHTCEKNFLELLAAANTINVDMAQYPPVDESNLLGKDLVWQQLTLQQEVTNASLQSLLILWQISIEIDKTAQFYQQAATNSAHPQTRLFFNSLSHVKKILHRRINGIIQIYCNYYWGELGFAPFMLGKD